MLAAVQTRLVDGLGLPDLVFEVPADPRPQATLPQLKIAAFLPGGPTGPYVFTTTGICQHPLPDGRRLEVMLAFQPAPAEHLKDPILRLLTTFALHLVDSPQPVHIGQVIRAEQDMAELSPMRGLMFAPPVFLDPGALKLGGPEAPVELLWLLPIYDTEAQVVLKEGPAALLARFTAAETPLLNFQRPPAPLQAKPPRPAAKPKPKAKPGPRLKRARPSARGPVTTRPTPSARAAAGYAGGPPAKAPPAHTGTGPGDRPRPRPKLKPKQRPELPTRKPEVRFDLDQDQAEPPSLKPRLPPPRSLTTRKTPDDLAADKQARIEALKQKAQDANRRAKARAQRAKAPPED